MESICRTCCRPVSSPYRRYDSEGKIVEGCVDSDHNGHLPNISNTSHWHNRQAAKVIRKTIDKYRNPK